MAERSKEDVAFLQLIKLTMMENRVWEIPTEKNFVGMSSELVALRNEDGSEKKDKQGNVVKKPLVEAHVLNEADPYFLKTAPDQIPASAEQLPFRDKLADPKMKAGVDVYAQQYMDVIRLTQETDKVAPGAGKAAVDYVDALYEEGGPGGKGLAPLAITIKALQEKAPGLLAKVSPELMEQQVKTAEMWPQGFDAKNVVHLRQLQEAAKPYLTPMGQPPQTISDNPVLEAALIAAKKEHFTDATVGPGYVNDLAKQAKLDLPEGYKEYNDAFMEAVKNKTKFPDAPKSVIEFVQERVNVTPTGTMDAATKSAIIVNKNDYWIGGTVTNAVLGSIDKGIDNLKKSLPGNLQEVLTQQGTPNPKVRIASTYDIAPVDARGGRASAINPAAGDVFVVARHAHDALTVNATGKAYVGFSDAVSGGKDNARTISNSGGELVVTFTADQLSRAEIKTGQRYPGVEGNFTEITVGKEKLYSKSNVVIAQLDEKNQITSQMPAEAAVKALDTAKQQKLAATGVDRNPDALGAPGIKMAANEAANSLPRSRGAAQNVVGA